MSKSTNMEMDPYLEYVNYAELFTSLSNVGNVSDEQLNRILALSEETLPVSHKATMLQEILHEISQKDA